MADSSKTKKELIEELQALRSRIAELQRAQARPQPLEQALRGSERLFRGLVENARDVICMFDPNAYITYVSPAVTDTLGYLPQELIGKHGHILFGEESRQYRSHIFQARLQGESVPPYEVMMRTSQGASVPAEVSAANIYGPDGKIEGVLAVLRNISERKRAEQVLRESEEKFRNVFEESPIAIELFDSKGRLVDANKAALDVFGVADIDRVKGFSLFEDPNLPDEVKQKLRSGTVAKFQAPFDFEKVKRAGLYETTRSGLVYLDVMITPLQLTGKEPPAGYLIQLQDITEQKHAEAALRESEEKWRSLVQSAPDVILTVDSEGKILFLNRTVPPMTPKKAIGTSVYRYVPSRHQHTLRESLKHVFQTGEPVTYELEGLGPHGRTSWYQSRLGPIKRARRVVAATLVATDITERKRMEDALRKSENKYRTLLENLPQKIFLKDSTSVYVSCNENYAVDLKIKPDQIAGRTDYDFYPKELAEKYRADDRAIVESGQTRDIEEKYIQDGREVIVHTVKTPVRDEQGNVVGILGIFWDITEPKRAQDALRESEERYRTLFQGSAEGILVADVKTKKLKYANPALCRMLGYTEPEFKQMSVHDIHPKESLDHVISEFDAQARGEKTLSPSVPCRRKDGTIMYADINTARVRIDARECNVGFFTDVTERKKAEQALGRSEQQYRALCDNIPGMVYRADPDWSTRVVSDSYSVCGYSARELNSKRVNWLDIIHPDDKAKVVREAVELQKRHTEIVQQYRVIDKSGAARWVEDHKTSRFTEDAVYDGVDGVVFDITERKQAEQALQKAREHLETRVQQRTADLAKAVEELQTEIIERERAEKALRAAEERFRTIFENTVIGLYRTTPDGRILMANPALVRMLGCSSFEQLAEINLEQQGFEPSHPRSTFKQRLEKEGKIIGLESVWIRPDGSRLFVCESAVAIRDNNGNVLYYEGTVEDITERKRAEEKLLVYQKQLRSLASELSLAEERLRRRLATDVHDHIGQNLAISKIKLESLRQSVPSPQLAASLAEISEMLAQTIESTRSLTFELSPPVLYELGFEAAVEWLVRQTRQRHGLAAEFETDGRAKPLDNNVRVLLFLAVRELLVNVAKHARAQNVTVSSRRLTNEIQVSVEDDGIGFDTHRVASQDHRTGGFGLFSIRERLGHIGGRLEVESRPNRGTRVTLVAPLNHARTVQEK